MTTHERGEARRVCQLYLVSPLDVGGEFPRRLERALDAGPVAAFQFRVKGIDQHEAARLAEPLQAICAAHDVAFIVNDSIALAKRLGADGVHLGQDDGDVARSARRCSARGADRRHLPCQPPPRDGSGRGRAPTTSLRQLLPEQHQGERASAGSELARLVARRLRDTLRRHRRDHARQLRAAPEGGRGFPGGVRGRWCGDEAAAMRAFREAIETTSLSQ